MVPPEKPVDTQPESEGDTPLRSGPGDFPALQLAERYLAESVFSHKALRVFEEAVVVYPDRADYQRALEVCRLVQHAADKSRRRLGPSATPIKQDERKSIEQLVEQFPTSADLAKCLGDICLLDGDWEAACRAYREAQSRGYPDNQAVVNSGLLSLARADSPPFVLIFFADTAETLGQFSQAAEFLTEALRRSKNDRQTMAVLLDRIGQRVLPRLEASPQKQLLVMETIEACLDQGLMEQALVTFREIDFSGYPSSDLVKRVARHLVEREDYRQAFDYLSRLPFDTEVKDLLNEIAAQLEKRGEMDTTVVLLRYINEHDLVIQEGQRAVENWLESEATREMADRSFRGQRFDDALAHYVRLIQQGSGHVVEFAERLEVSARKSLNPKVEDLFFLGEFYFRRREWIRATAFLERALEKEPDSIRVGQLLRTIYDTLLRTKPNLAEVRLKSGDLYLSMNRLQDAFEEYRSVLETEGYEGVARRRMAAAYLKAGEPLQAFEQFHSLALEAGDMEFLYALHEGLMSAGQFPDALQAARMIYEFDNKFRDVGERIAELERTTTKPDSSQAQSDPKMIELIGEEAIGRYRYIEQVGSGGMGVVHKVEDLKNHRIVAMKILRDALTSSSKAIDRFFREARIAATLSHPNIVNIYDYNINTMHGKSYISMEYVDGPSLRDVIEDRFAMGNAVTPDYIAEILYYGAQLCDALEVTHLKGIIHRDIKPDNIMLTSEKMVKITDFGIVHIEQATFTPIGAMIGTPRYMSPEQVRGSRVDCRSDIYAVGIILYESLLGQPPFITGDIAYQHLNVGPAPPRQINPAIPQEVEAVILKCLEKDSRQRYQEAKELNLALRDVLRKLYPKVACRFYGGSSFASTDAPAGG